ncbi:MAG TPA: DUF2911 domain-containing protein [Gemmatimonadales bacterium]|nr:DUF2911 domain-containing protein [Gemmatimonadales bacterium]
MSRVRLGILAGAAIVAIAAVIATTGISLVPTSLALGPCLKDWTSGVSYRPRLSPLASADLTVGDDRIRLCYGRPVRHNRTIFGGVVPFDSLWRMGANEPTRLYTGRPITFAGIPLAAGRYSVYTIPHRDRWEIFVSRSTLHWGNDISSAVRAREVGQATVPVEQLATPVETLTVRTDSTGTEAFTIEWETTRVSLPVTPGH